MLAGLPYCFKFLWAPYIDQWRIPILANLMGHRRSWALLAQVGVIISLVFLALIDPREAIYGTFVASFCVSLCAATLDTVIDACRIELLSDHDRAMGASVEAIGFRIGMLASGAGALYLAASFGWVAAYMIMAGTMVVGFIAIFVAPLDDHSPVLPQKVSYYKPFQTLLQNYPIPLLLGFIFCFKATDTVLNSMSARFFYELGMTEVQFADISKIFGILLMIPGAFAGGLLLKFIGDRTGVLLALALQGASSLMFALQTLIGHHLGALMITVGVESFASGMTSTVFIVYISKFCSAPYTATHFTLLYSFGSLSRVVISSLSSHASEYISWATLFVGSAIIIFPGLIFLYMLEREERGKGMLEDIKVKNVA